MNSVPLTSIQKSLSERLKAYDIDIRQGFLPAEDPIEKLPIAYQEWEEIAADFAGLLISRQLRQRLDRLPPLPLNALRTEPERQRAMLLLSIFANGYVWTEESAAKEIARGVAMPLCELATLLGRPPIVAHASMVLQNWYKVDPAGPLALDNIAARQLFLGGMDEQWFYLVTVAIEAAGAAAMPLLLEMQDARENGDVDLVELKLNALAGIITEMFAILQRMPEKCDPYIFYHRVRPYVTGWPAPGVIYSGVDEKPKILAGGSAAQSSLLQAIDAALGVQHQNSAAGEFLLEMRRYMPPAHRAFVEMLEVGAGIAGFVQERTAKEPGLSSAFNDCIGILDRFRKYHMEIAVRYISHQAKDAASAKGTGGTSFVPFLSAARKNTRETGVAED